MLFFDLFRFVVMAVRFLEEQRRRVERPESVAFQCVERLVEASLRSLGRCAAEIGIFNAQTCESDFVGEVHLLR